MKSTMPPGLYETPDMSPPGEPLTLATLPGAMVVLADGSMIKPCDTPIGRAAAREALALLRDVLAVSKTRAEAEDRYGIALAVRDLDRLAERFR